MGKPSLFMQALVLDMAENPQDYCVGNRDYTLDHPRSGLRIWISCTRLGYHIYKPTEARLSWADKRAFHRARTLWAQASTMAKFRTIEGERPSLARTDAIA